MSRTFKLPKADSFGNFWFGNKYEDPAIFPIRCFHAENQGKYFLSLGGDKGVVFYGSELMAFVSPEEALEYLNRIFKRV